MNLSKGHGIRNIFKSKKFKQNKKKKNPWRANRNQSSVLVKEEFKRIDSSEILKQMKII